MRDEPKVTVPDQRTTDAALVAGVRAGNEDAMTALYDRYSPIVYAVALRVLGDTAAAEDVMQEIFMRLWRKPQLFDSSRGSMGAWLAVVSRNQAIDSLRRQKPETPVEDVVLTAAENLDDSTERNLLASRVRALLREMPQEQQKAMELAFFQGMSHAEIAKNTGEPLGTVKTRIRSALIKIRKELAI